MQRRYREENKEKCKVFGKAYYEQNREKLLARRAENVSCPVFADKMRRDSCDAHLRNVHNTSIKAQKALG
jgi:hypothetical protein